MPFKMPSMPWSSNPAWPEHMRREVWKIVGVKEHHHLAHTWFWEELLILVYFRSFQDVYQHDLSRSQSHIDFFNHNVVPDRSLVKVKETSWCIPLVWPLQCIMSIWNDQVPQENTWRLNSSTIFVQELQLKSWDFWLRHGGKGDWNGYGLRATF